MFKILVEKWGDKYVGMESDTGRYTKIDITVNSNDGIILYEIKAYPSALTSIREAVGQLLEYAYYPDPIKNLHEIIIVSHILLKQEDKEYLKLIRANTSLKIYYQTLDVNQKILSAKQ